MNAHIELIKPEAASREVSVDPRAVVDSTAILDPGCSVGAFAVIGENVHLGSGCRVHPHAVLFGPAKIGPRNEFHPFSCIGGAPQDLRHNGEPTELVIGAGNVFREHVTINRGTVHGGGRTTVGDHNLFMAYTHVAHDCTVGDHVVMANHATLAGHTQVGDHAVFGGMVGVATFLRIGESAMLAAGSMVEREVPPFCTVAGDRARLRAVNRVGLERRGIDPTARQQIKSVFRMLRDPCLTLPDIVGTWRSQCADALSPEAERMVDFLDTVSRGLTR